MVTLRQRNRLGAMRLTQRTALDLFIEHGFDNVTIGRIADEVGMAASTIYRHFSTKEAIVLWDEHDPAIDEALTAALKSQPPMAAIRDVFVEVIGGRYDHDLEFQLRRIKYIYSTEQLHAAAVEADFADRAELADGVAYFLSKKHRDAAPLIAGAAMLALDVAMDRWQRNDASTPLGVELAKAFEQLSSLDDLS